MDSAFILLSSDCCRYQISPNDRLCLACEPYVFQYLEKAPAIVAFKQGTTVLSGIKVVLFCLCKQTNVPPNCYSLLSVCHNVPSFYFWKADRDKFQFFYHQDSSLLVSEPCSYYCFLYLCWPKIECTIFNRRSTAFKSCLSSNTIG